MTQGFLPGKSKNKVGYRRFKFMKYDVIIIGAGPGGIFSAYELLEQNKDLKIAVFEAGAPLEKRRCPIDGDKVKPVLNVKRVQL